MQFKNVVAAPLASLVFSFALTHAAYAAPISGQGSWESTLQGRDIHLNAVSATSESAVYLYASDLGITWLRDANLNGEMDWATANQWASDLVTGSGATQISDWRLPGMTIANISSCEFEFAGTNCGYNVNPSSSEFAHLFQLTLGNQSRYDALGDERLLGAGLTNSGSFRNLQAGGYWLADQFDTEAAWRFDSYDGVQDVTFKQIPFYAMAVRSGDVLAVPEPATLTLTLGGLACLGLAMRRRQRAGNDALS
ncbi:PEP-CTERM sorting domain-containing protein [Paucibacter sp. M5-1]|uniref:PEP-CTERM sorting domain-containing protein n=1 Tax=Paucibacter sp. M5-1 TaxID=3015998 RepID=UPI003F8152D8